MYTGADGRISQQAAEAESIDADDLKVRDTWWCAVGEERRYERDIVGGSRSQSGGSGEYVVEAATETWSG